MLLAFSVLNLLFLLALGTVLFRVRKRLFKTRREMRRLQERKKERAKISPGSRAESLLTLYRMLDRQPLLTFGQSMAVAPDFLVHVVERVQSRRPMTIVECGVGTSTVVLAYALKTFGIDGHIYGLENHPPSVETTRQRLREMGLESFATIIPAPLSERRYSGIDQAFRWYQFSPESIPDQIDLLIVDGPFTRVNRLARYPAGPELLPRLAPNGRVFIDDSNRRDEQEMVRLWIEASPGFSKQELRAERGCIELYRP